MGRFCIGTSRAVCIAFLALTGCTTAPLQRPDSTAGLGESGKTFATPFGKTHRITTTNSRNNFPREFDPLSVGAAPSDGQTFSGTKRRAAKLTLATPDEVEVFDTLLSLKSSLVPDEVMRDRTPKITSAANSKRVAEEDRNVEVVAWLHAAAKEEDNDFHLIIGTKSCSLPKCFMTAEVSGIPASGVFRLALKSARKQFTDYFGGDLPGRDYDTYDPPIKIRISGSLFFDIPHQAGGIGPGCCKPDTVWEIHPVMEFEVLDD